MFAIIYDVVQNYYKEWCSLENVSSLLRSLIAENNGDAGAGDKRISVPLNVKVPTLKKKCCTTLIVRVICFCRAWFDM